MIFRAKESLWQTERGGYPTGQCLKGLHSGRGDVHGHMSQSGALMVSHVKCGDPAADQIAFRSYTR